MVTIDQTQRSLELAKGQRKEVCVCVCVWVWFDSVATDEEERKWDLGEWCGLGPVGGLVYAKAQGWQPSIIFSPTRGQPQTHVWLNFVSENLLVLL